MSFICYNGHFLPIEQPGLLATNRSFKWGDGVFETIKLFQGRMLLEAYHMERLFSSMQLLQIKATFSREILLKDIVTLCAKNNCIHLARVRLAVYRGEEDEAGYTIEAVPLEPEVMSWNKYGYKVDTYPFTRKACDVWANLKTPNYLPYVMAGRYAKEQGLDECLVLNSFQHICDASKANVFLIKDQMLVTPALGQGCINGVMRRFVIDEVKKQGRPVLQTELTEAMLLEADECFLTNAIQGIRWVEQYRNKQYAQGETRQLFEVLLSTIYS